jgi:N-acetylneuraminate lyase
MATAEAYVDAAAGRIPIIVQVGHNSLAEARALAAHAESIGADAISAMPPSYYKFTSMETLVDCLSEIASAADLPFFFYYIPAMSGMEFDMVELLDGAGGRIPTLAGLKYTAPTVDEYQRCLEFADGRFTILFGRDEMLLSALCVGCKGAVGSTYNIAAPLYRRIIEAFERGEMVEAARCQGLSNKMITICLGYGGLPAFKAVMKMIGVDCGPNRLPIKTLAAEQTERLRAELQNIGFFDWAMGDG